MITLQKKIKGTLQIFRLELPSAAGVCVVLGELLALGAFPAWGAAGLGFAVGFFLSSSALIFNDYFDLEVDRINAPQRPLPAGLLSPGEVIALGVLTAALGLAAAWALNPLALALSLPVWLLGLVYNWKLKAAGLWGNLCVSASVAMTFILGGVGVGQAWNGLVWVFGLIAFVFDLGEEIAADAMDAAGDQKRGSKSIALVYGRQTALRLAGLLFGGVVVLTLVPFVWGGLGWRYLLAVLFIDTFILVFTLKLLRSQTVAEGRWSVRALYLSASAGLLAFVVGAFFW